MPYKKYPNFPHPDKNKTEELIFENQKFINTKNRSENFEILNFSTNYTGWTNELNKISTVHINENHPIDIASRELCIKLIKKYDNSKDNVVLEVGCSNGRLIKHIKKNAKYNYIGSDAIKENVLALSKYYKDIPFLVFDLLKNPFKESICNTLIMLNVLEHIENDNLALKEAHRILKKDGILIIEVPASKVLYDSYDKNLLHYRRYNMQEFLTQIKNAGFKIEYKTHLGFLIFPFFAFMKLINKIFIRENVVPKQAKSSDNFLVKSLLNIEKKLSQFYLPFGIRCYVCARKINL